MMFSEVSLANLIAMYDLKRISSGEFYNELNDRISKREGNK